MSAEYISAWATVGTLVVVVASVLAPFVQLRHMGVLNGLTALNEFREEFTVRYRHDDLMAESKRRVPHRALCRESRNAWAFRFLTIGCRKEKRAGA